MADTCLIFFRTGAAEIESAAAVLGTAGLIVSSEGDHLVVSRSGAPQFAVYLNTAPWVKEEAAEIAGDTPTWNGLRECEARFEIVIPDLDAALDEANTLMEIQGELQDVCNGYLFLSWNGELLPPSAN